MAHRQRHERERMPPSLRPVDSPLDFARTVSADDGSARRAQQPPPAPRQLPEAAAADAPDQRDLSRDGCTAAP